MLKQLQKRFIIFAMVAFGAVAVIMIVGINLLNYAQTIAKQDETLDAICSYHLGELVSPDKTGHPIAEMPRTEGGTEFVQRYFSTLIDERGNLLVFERDYINSIDEYQARAYTSAVMDKQTERGYYGEYRYKVKELENGYTLVTFLNVSMSEVAQNRLLYSSIIIGLVGTLITFAVVFLLSRRVVEPYVRNNELQKRFITDAGHELKTPITSIATSADILALEMEDNEWVNNIKAQTSRLGHLVNELTMLARMDEGTKSVMRSMFVLSDAAWETAEAFITRSKAEEKTLEIRIEDNVEYVGDRAALQRMLGVLLDNAFAYSDPEGTISLSLVKEKGKVVIEVFNTCENVPDVDLNQLFNRFYRLDESRSKNTGGSGIGLSIARAVVENHGGKISVFSADKKSMTFRVVL